ncbi:hypothetical protein NCCP2495_31300 [Dietzia sp. NCCP-2495]|nr:hypothetical protein NCCP2495_31300 [Dietzia sp. NCCP-2495]
MSGADQDLGDIARADTGQADSDLDDTGPDNTEVGDTKLGDTKLGDTELVVRCHLDRLLYERGLTLSALAEKVGVTVVNLSVLKNDRAKAIRFSTLVALCRELDCQPGDLLTVGEPA